MYGDDMGYKKDLEGWDHSCLEIVGEAEFLSHILEFLPCLGEVFLLSHLFVVVDGLEAELVFVVHEILEGEHVSVDQLQEVVQMNGFLSAGEELTEDIFPILDHLCLENLTSFCQLALPFKLSPDLASIVLSVVKFLDFL